jgi:dTDP-3-amino-3,4,6-trideoxy-alpha-D-glucose transaminase
MAELLERVREVAASGQFTGGGELLRFEEEFASFCGASHAVGVASGTAALELALRALGIGPGDEVVVPANSFIATAEAVSLCGAVPRFADVEPDTALLSGATLARHLTPRVKAVIPVHLYGRTAPMDEIGALARAHGAFVIEDAAQAHGARYRGRMVGSLADLSCFSFYPSKNLGAWGDAGAVTTEDASLADRIRLLRAHGEQTRYQHLIPGTTARLDALQAAILRIKLRRLEEWNERRRVVARWFNAALEGILEVPAPPEADGDHVYHQYVVRHEHRDALRRHLQDRRVASAIHYPVPIHLTPAYIGNQAPRLPVVESLARTICSLPIFPSISDLELEAVVDACASFARSPACR